MLIHTTSGLIYQHDGTLTGWTDETSVWSALTASAPVSFDPSLDLVGPGSTYDAMGCREPQILVDDDGTYVLMYDSGDGATGWRTFYATSPDGITWTKQGVLGPGLDKIGGGTWAATANGFLAKFAGRYYLYRVLANAAFSSPNIGLPAAPYYGDVWSASSLAGTWTAESSLPTSGGWAAGSYLPGSVVLSGGTYYLFGQAGSGSTLGLLTASAPGGPFVPSGSAILTATNSLGNQTCENPKIAWHPGLSQWLCFVNVIDHDGNYTRCNAVGVSSSLTDWSAAQWYPFQVYGAVNSPNAIGVLSPVYRADGSAAIAADGSIAVTYDGFPTSASPGWHLGRHVRATSLALFTGGLTDPTGSADLLEHRIYRALAHGDCTIELTAAIRAINGGGEGVRVEVRSADSTFANSYAVVLMGGGLGLEKMTGGAGRGAFLRSPLYSPSVYPRTGDGYRIKIVLSGATITAYMDGVQHWTYTDASSPYLTGSYIAVNTQGASLDVWGLRVYSAPSVALTGLPAGATVSPTWPGLAVPTSSVTADGSGAATLTLGGYPAPALAVDGAAVTADAAVYGGDALSAPVLFAPGSRAVAAGGPLIGMGIT